MKCLLLFLLLLVSTQVHAQLTFRASFIKSYNKRHPQDAPERQPYEATIVLDAPAVRFLDNSMWGNILYPLVRLETSPDTHMHTWVCEDRTFTYDVRNSTLTVTYPTTNEVNVYYGSPIE